MIEYTSQNSQGENVARLQEISKPRHSKVSGTGSCLHSLWFSTLFFLAAGLHGRKFDRWE